MVKLVITYGISTIQAQLKYFGPIDCKSLFFYTSFPLLICGVLIRTSINPRAMYDGVLPLYNFELLID